MDYFASIICQNAAGAQGQGRKKRGTGQAPCPPDGNDSRKKAANPRPPYFGRVTAYTVFPDASSTVPPVSLPRYAVTSLPSGRGIS